MGVTEIEKDIKIIDVDQHLLKCTGTYKRQYQTESLHWSFI